MPRGIPSPFCGVCGAKRVVCGTRNQKCCKVCQKRRDKARVRNWTREHRQPHRRFSDGYQRAKERGLEWTIPQEEYWHLIRQPCYYCGSSLNPTGAGLDRKDNSRGYTSDNVVPCCRACNLMKSNLWTAEEFLQISHCIRTVKQARAA